MISQPNGPTQRNWFSNGYKQAMEDILAKFNEEGPEAAKEWAESNG